MDENKVQLKDGEVIIRKPKAKVRNAAMMKAETPEGLKNTVFMVELLPYCVKTHPWGVRPVRDCLDNLDVDEYDKLVDCLRGLMHPDENQKKKLNRQSDLSKPSTDGQQE
jgi:hypothetical protein